MVFRCGSSMSLGCIFFLLGCSDQKSPINLMKSSQREMCKIFLLAEKYQPAIFDDTLLSKPNEIIDVQGLACKSNKSLSLLTMDSLLHYHFADKLGVDLTKYKDKTAAVIIDDKVVILIIYNIFLNVFPVHRWSHIILWNNLSMLKL